VHRPAGRAAARPTDREPSRGSRERIGYQVDRSSSGLRAIPRRVHGECKPRARILGVPKHEALKCKGQAQPQSSARGSHH